MSEKMDVVSRLGVFRNVCERMWLTPAELTKAASGLPYLKVGVHGKVHVVLFPAKHLVRVYFSIPYKMGQTALTYPMDRAPGGKWMSNDFIESVTLVAAAVNYHLETHDFS